MDRTVAAATGAAATAVSHALRCAYVCATVVCLSMIGLVSADGGRDDQRKPEVFDCAVAGRRNWQTCDVEEFQEFLSAEEETSAHARTL